MSLAIVLLPGMDGTGDLFAPLVSALGSSLETIIVRYPNEPANYLAHEAFVSTQLPPDRPYVLLGESFSGPIVVSIAATLPPLLLGCILCASFVSCPSPFLRLVSPLLTHLPATKVPDLLAEPFLMGRFATDELRAAHASAMQKVAPKTLLARLKAIASVDVREPLRRVRVPSLYLRASEDRLVAADAGDQFMRYATDARLAEIQGPHFLLQASASSAAKEILAFARHVTPNKSLERTRVG